MKPKLIVFKADANKRIGIGCITKSLALADVLKPSFPLLFVTEDKKEAVELIKSRGYRVITHSCWQQLEEEINGVAEILRQLSGENEVIFVIEYKILNQQLIKEASKIASKTVIIANYPQHQLQPDADAVINANIFPAKGKEAVKEGNTRYFFGPKYMILDRAFAQAPAVPPSTEVESILVTMGGSDPENTTMDVVRALNTLDSNFHTTVVIGPFYSHEPELQKLIADSPKAFTLKKNLPSAEMFELMQKSDLAISAAGISLYELCCLGIPTIAVPWSVVDNHQAYIAKAFAENEAVLNLGLHKEASVEKIAKEISLVLNDFGVRKKLSENAVKMVDGKGVLRVKEAIESLLR